MRSIAIIARHDLLMTLRDRSGVFWLLLMPVVFATFFGLVLGGGSSGPPSDSKARLSVVDLDQQHLSRLLVDGLANERLEVVELQPEEQATTEDKLRTLVIPAGFTETVLRGEQVTLRLEKDPGSNQEAALVAQARIVAVVSRLISRLIQVSAQAEQAQPEAQDQAAPVGSRPSITADMVPALSPPEQDLVLLETRFAGRKAEPPNGFAQSMPGMAVMFVLLAALTYGAASLTAERSHGRLRRLLTAPVVRRDIVLGKIAGRLVVAVVQITILVGVGWLATLVTEISLGDNLVGVWIVLLCYAAAVAPLGVLLGAWLKDPDRAANLGAIATMIMAAFGGCWWPIEIVSRPLQLVSMLLPTGWAMRALHGFISYGHGFVEVVPALLVLLGFAAVFSVLAARALRVE